MISQPSNLQFSHPSQTNSLRYSIKHARSNAFQIVRLRHTEQDRVIARLGSFLKQLDLAMGIAAGRGNNAQKQIFSHVIRAGAGDEHTAWIEQLESAEVDLFVAASGGVHAGTVFRKRRRVEHDRIKAFARLFEFTQTVEDIRFAKRDVARMVEPGILACRFDWLR